MLLLDHEPRLAAMDAAHNGELRPPEVWWPSFETMPSPSPLPATMDSRRTRRLLRRVDAFALALVSRPALLASLMIPLHIFFAIVKPIRICEWDSLLYSLLHSLLSFLAHALWDLASS